MEPTNTSSMQSSLPLNTMFWQHTQLAAPQQEQTATTTTMTSSCLPCDKLGTQKSLRKKRRAPRRAATTVLTTDATNFRAMVQEFTGIPSSPLLSPKVTTSNFYPFRPHAHRNPLLNSQSYSLLNGNLPFQSVVQQQPGTISSSSCGNINTNATLTYNPGSHLQELSEIFGNDDQLFMFSNDANMCSSTITVPHMGRAWCDTDIRSLVSSNDDRNGVDVAAVAHNIIVSDRNKNDSNQQMERVIGSDNLNVN